ncbi:uncharacterized protein LOC126790538 [Argentina anserina]|uniref:uncharacterized protein LOC126790538 n=1 Tax=Argentina anserina TaxID=57926 RepID=UPI0021767536|nr:uncharacterized protein LOC126790538 [Potentilla anserina]XP_050372773.1 uncharacterized protein LOC126790538 [Potentilla anserina]
MYNSVGAQPGVPRPSPNPQPNPFGNTFYGAGSGLIRGGLGAYGEKILGSSSEYVQSNISRYFSDPQYYFQVNDQYVRNKLKVVLFPFLHRGHWTRITEPVGGRLSYKPPIYDINAPDLYIPFMAFGTYVVLAGFSLGRHGKFSPEALNWLFIKGLLGWFVQVLILKFTLFSLGSGEAPLLDVVAYAGYTFTGLCLAVLGRIMWNYSYYFVMPWTCVCMGIFLVKTMKRVLFAEVRSYDSSKHHYLLLFIALAQFPVFTWLGNVSVNWLL